MDLKSLRKTIAGRIDRLSGRERVISVLMLVFIVVGGFYILLYKPASQKANLKQQTLQTLKNDIEVVNTALSSQVSLQKNQIAEDMKLPEAEDLSGLLAAISREASMARVDFISIAPEGFEYKDNFIIMRVKIELRVRFREMYDFLRSIELRHRLFLIRELKFETNSALYPSGIAILEVVTYLRKKQ